LAFRYWKVKDQACRGSAKKETQPFMFLGFGLFEGIEQYWFLRHSNIPRITV